MRVLGIDPGYERLGVAVVEKNGKERLIYSDCIVTPSKANFEKRLFIIGKEIKRVIKKYEPDALAIERGFFNTNQKTAMGVSEARGVVVYESASKKIPVFNYAPLQIKIAVTGYGKSDKKQVAEMIKRLIEVKKEIKYDDEFDAIAVCITHLAQNH